MCSSLQVLAMNWVNKVRLGLHQGRGYGLQLGVVKLMNCIDMNFDHNDWIKKIH